MEKRRKGSVVGGALLVAGTAIGGGMLALPILTAQGGFLPAIFLYFLCWIFMASTGLLFVETCLWNEKEVNIISMAESTLGKWGKGLAWVLYLFLFYSLTVAYVAGGGNLMNDLLELFSKAPRWVGPLVFVLLFAPFVFISARAVAKINVIFVGGLVLTFLLFVVMGARHVRFDFLTRHNLKLAFIALPLAFTAFGFQGIVPTLTNYLNRDPKKISKAIWWGSGIAFGIYVIWEWLILGIAPLEGTQGLLEAKKQGQTAVYPLKNILSLPWLFVVGEFFAFFAIVTSFWGVTLGLLDFLADGLKIVKNKRGRLFLCLLIFIPPLAFALSNPCVFLNALTYAGGLGAALLLGLLPVLMVWFGRYYHWYKGPYAYKGGKLVLLLLGAFILFELTIVAIQTFTG